MYQLQNIANNTVLGYTEAPYYILRTPSGALAPTDEEHAQGLAYKSTPYNLAGRDGVGMDITVAVFHYDSGDVVVEQEKEKSIIGGERAIRPYEVGEYITVGGTLYRVILPILVGATITPGTNVEETDIATELSKLTLGGN